MFISFFPSSWHYFLTLSLKDRVERQMNKNLTKERWNIAKSCRLLLCNVVSHLWVLCLPSGSSTFMGWNPNPPPMCQAVALQRDQVIRSWKWGPHDGQHEHPRERGSGEVTYLFHHAKGHIREPERSLHQTPRLTAPLPWNLRVWDMRNNSYYLSVTQSEVFLTVQTDFTNLRGIMIVWVH